MSSTENTKKLNKKVIIFGAIGLLLVAAIVVALVIGLGNKKTVNTPVDTDETTLEAIDTTEETNDVSETDEITDTARPMAVHAASAIPHQ